MVWSGNQAKTGTLPPQLRLAFAIRQVNAPACQERFFLATQLMLLCCSNAFPSLKFEYMQHKSFKQPAIAAMLLLASFFTALEGGVDSYEIYLNNKLLMRQLATQSLSLKSLPLDKAKPNNQLVIYYSHCGTIGKGRKIAIKNEAGQVVKEWKFADAIGTKTGMTIPVKELLQLQNKYAKNQLSLYYSSVQIP
jgi:hypothetical protein